MIEPRRANVPQILSEEQAQRCWKILTYELDMFLRLSDYLTPDHVAHEEFRGFRAGVKNAVVESCILHCRNVCDIFLSRGQPREDIRLDDLLPGFDDPSLNALKEVYGLRSWTGNIAHTLHYQALQPWMGRSTGCEYGPILARIHPLILAVIEAIGEYAGPAIREALASDDRGIMGD